MNELKTMRRASAMTQREVARTANVSKRAYQSYEYDKRCPDARTAIRIARAVGGTVEEIWGEED